MKKNLNIINRISKVNSKKVLMENKKSLVGKTKYFPSFAKEWKNTVYSFNKNSIKNIPVNTIIINKLIRNYFDLYFKNYQFINSRKYILLRRRRNFLRRIHISGAEIKHLNNKAVINLYIVNREKQILNKKYAKLKKKFFQFFIPQILTFYFKKLTNFYKILAIYKNKFTYIPLNKKQYLVFKLNFLNKSIILSNLYLRKLFLNIISKYIEKYLNLFRKYNFLYSLNQSKFNKLLSLPYLNAVIDNVLEKKTTYNFINLKSIIYNTDLFTNLLALKIKKGKQVNYLMNMFAILGKARLPLTNTIKERSVIKKNIDFYQYKFSNTKILSNIQKSTLEKLLNNTYFNNLTSKTKNKKIKRIIFNNINYKNLSGIRLEVKGRLTKRYRADRALYSLKLKGGLKNIDSSFKKLSSVLFRGNTNSNNSYSLATSKRRIGSFAVKGWIAGK